LITAIHDYCILILGSSEVGLQHWQI